MKYCLFFLQLMMLAELMRLLQKELAPKSSKPNIKSQDDIRLASAAASSRPVASAGDDDGVSAEQLAVQKIRQLKMM